MSITADWAHYYNKQLGWKLVPIPRGQKGPHLTGWNREENCWKNGSPWPIAYENIGLAHAYSYTVAFDIDDVEATRPWLRKHHKLDLDELLNAPDGVQILSSNPNHAKLLYRIPKDVTVESLQTVKIAHEGKTLMEFRCADSNGNTVQDVLPPSIHPNGMAYRWHGDPAKMGRMPRALYQVWDKQLDRRDYEPEKFAKQFEAPAQAPVEPAQATQVFGPINTPAGLGDVPQATMLHIQGALNSLHPDMERGDWVKVAMALKSTGDSRMYRMWRDWSAKGKKFKDDADCERVWRSLKRSGITLRTLFWMARKAGWKGAGLDLEALFGGVEVGPGAASSEPQAGAAADIAQGVTLRTSEYEIARDFITCTTGIAHVPAWETWLYWDGKVWVKDENYHVFNMVCRYVDRVAESDNKRARTLRKHTTMKSIDKQASTDQRIVMRENAFDQDDWKLNTPGGVVDLQTGAVLAHDPGYHMAKITACGPQRMDTPLWNQFLWDVTSGNNAMIGYLQRIAGYSLTGSTDEHVLFFFHGAGRNGKNVFLDTMRELMGEDYAKSANADMLTKTYGDKHPQDIAKLAGTRLVVGSEVPEGGKWDVQRLKSLTGGERLSARFMRQNDFEFQPKCTLLIAGNHKPSFGSIDVAIRDRIHLVPFEVYIPPEKRDIRLKAKLRAEWPGILQWMIDGAVEYQRVGIVAPETARGATEQYMSEEDTFGMWLEECCEIDAAERTPYRELFADWRSYCEQGNFNPGNHKTFAQQLTKAGFKQAPGKSGGRKYIGLKISARIYSTDE